MVQQTFKIVEELFGDIFLSSTQPNVDELYDYTVALVNGEDMAKRFPAVHAYVQQMGNQDPHYQALLAVLRLEAEGQLELPPVEPQFDFSYLSSSSPIEQPWRVELNRLLIELTEQVLAAFIPAATQPAAYRKSAGEQAVFELAFTDTASGVNVKIAALADSALADRVTVQVGITAPNRRWPHLKGMPITLTTSDASPITQATDAFGKTIFPAMATAALRNATIAVGPLADWADD